MKKSFITSRPGNTKYGDQNICEMIMFIYMYDYLLLHENNQKSLEIAT